MLSVGTQLKKARERMNLTVEEAARALNLRVYYLQELESDHPELLPSLTQARGYVRLLARFYGLDAKILLEQWDSPPAATAVANDLATEIPNKKTKKSTAGKKEIAARDDLENVAAQARALLRSIQAQLRKTIQRLEEKVRSKLIKPKGEPAEKESVEQSTNQPQELEHHQPLHKGGKNSDELLRELGSALRGRRETLGLTIADVERFTMLKRFYIEALESGRLDDLPSTVQGRGMLSNYADFLAMKNDEVLGLFADALQRRREERSAPREPQKPALSLNVNLPESWRRILNPDLVFGSLIIITLFVLIFIGTARIFTRESQKPTEAPSIAQVLQQTPTDAVVLTPTAQDTAVPEAILAAPQSTPTPTIMPTVNAAPLQVYIITSQRVFLRVTVDGKSAFNGRTTPQGAYTFSGNQEIQVDCGNADGLEVYFNQEYQGKLGGVGEVVRLIFTLQGIQKTSLLQTPTPLQTPSATPNP